MPAADLLADGRDALIEAAFYSGDFTGAGALLEAACAEAEADGDVSVLAGALDQLGFLQHWRNIDSAPGDRDVDAELLLFERALAMRRENGDATGMAESLFHVGLVYQLFKRDWDAAQAYLEKALPLADAAGDLVLVSEIHRHTGAYHWVHKQDFPAALQCFRHSLALRETTDHAGWIASGLITLGQCELASGDAGSARSHLERALQIAMAGNLREMWLRAASDALAKVP